jgi:hypothetical protein
MHIFAKSCPSFFDLSFVTQTFAYDAVCYDATKGFVWICCTQLAIVFFSMLVMTLRVACFEIEDEEDFLKQRQWCTRLFCCRGSSQGDEQESEHNDNKGNGDKEDGGFQNGPIQSFDSDGDYDAGGYNDGEIIKADDSKSGPPGHDESEPTRDENRLGATTQAAIY